MTADQSMSLTLTLFSHSTHFKSPQYHPVRHRYGTFFSLFRVPSKRVPHVIIIRPRNAGIAASTRVGNAIGRRDAMGAKFTGHLSALLSALTGTIVMLSLLASKDVRPSLPIRSLSHSN